MNIPMEPYVKMDCTDLETRHEEVSLQITKVSHHIDDASVGSRLAMGVGVVFWPALFLVDGKGDAQDELAQLKGQKISIEDAMLEHDCASNPRIPAKLRTTQNEPPVLTILPVSLPAR